MKKKLPHIDLRNLPASAAEYIKNIIKKMRYRKKVRNDVMAELSTDFESEIKDCVNEQEKKKAVEKLIAEFGDVKMLGKLLRRAKKRCRPLWRKVATRTFQGIGIFILCFIVYVGWFISGEPTISVDYLAMLNQINKPEIAEQDNAWNDYEKAFELYNEPNSLIDNIDSVISSTEMDFEQLNDKQKDEIERWITANQPAWQQFTQASQKAYYYKKSEYDPNDENKLLFNVQLLNLAPIRQLLYSGIWCSKYHLSQENIEQALEDCYTIIRAGKHQHSGLSIVEQLVGINIRIIGCNQIQRIISQQQLLSEQLNSIQQMLRNLCADYSTKINIEAERLMFMDLVQNLFTKGGPGGGHIIPKRLSDLSPGDIIDDYGLTDSEILNFAAIVGSGLLHATRDDTVKQANKIYDKIDEILELTPYQKYQAEEDIEEYIQSLGLPALKYPLVLVFIPATERASLSAYRGKILADALIVILAIQRWKLEYGDYPSDLQELVEAGYLDDLPLDPWSDKPLIYKTTNEDFMLYGVGENFTDDGGQIVRDDQGNIREYTDEGDWVFWPVAPYKIEQ